MIRKLLSPSFLITIVFSMVAITSLMAQTTTTAVVYVMTNDPRLDAVVPELQNMVASLNKGGAASGHHYEFIPRDTFTDAKAFNDDHPSSISTVILVSHGTFDANDNYLNLLRDTRRDTDGEPIRTPDSEVDPYFVRSYHCGSDGKINAAQVGSNIAQFNGGHPYTYSTGGSGSSSAPPPSGGGGGGGGSASGSWTLMAFYGTYGYNTVINGNWTYVVVGYTAYCWVWTPNEDGGNQALAARLPQFSERWCTACINGRQTKLFETNEPASQQKHHREQYSSLREIC